MSGTNINLCTIDVMQMARGGRGINLPTPAVGAPPVVTLVSPIQGTVDPAALVVDVTDVELGSVVITAKYPLAKKHEVVFDDAFDEQYSGSSRVAITGGYRFTIVRNGGWLPGEVDLRVRAFDTDGNET
jgi:hypothetical protein